MCLSTLLWILYVFGGHLNQNGLLTIPGVLGLSAGLWVKLPLWLVETVCDFLLLRPMASIDWLLLRMTRYREKRGDTVSGSTLMLCGNTTHWLLFVLIFHTVKGFDKCQVWMIFSNYCNGRKCVILSIWLDANQTYCKIPLQYVSESKGRNCERINVCGCLCAGLFLNTLGQCRSTGRSCLKEMRVWWRSRRV